MPYKMLLALFTLACGGSLAGSPPGAGDRTPTAADLALLEAIQRSDRVTAIRLLHCGADPNVEDVRGRTALMNAAERGQAGVVRAALANGGRATDKTIRGQTALLLATSGVYGSRPEVIRLLLDGGADVNARTKLDPSLRNWTPLMWTAHQGDSMSVHVLLDRGADPNAAESFSGTALHLAPGFFTGLAADEIVRALLLHGADPLRTDSAKRTVLHLVAEWGGLYSRSVRRLVGLGIKINALDFEHRTALATAAAHGRVAMVQALLALGADPNLPDQHGMTPLMLAARAELASAHWFPTQSYPGTLRALLQGGAGINLRSNDGRTALDWAKHSGLRRHIGLLRRHARLGGR